MTVPLSDMAAASALLRAWLESLPPDEVAGEPLTSRGCPLARFFRASGYPWALVGIRKMHPGGMVPDEPGAEIGEALYRFRDLADFDGDPLTARHCLALLDRAEREAGAC